MADNLITCSASTQLLIGDEVLSTFYCNLDSGHEDDHHNSYDEDGQLLASWVSGTSFHFGIDEENTDEVG